MPSENRESGGTVRISNAAVYRDIAKAALDDATQAQTAGRTWTESWPPSPAELNALRHRATQQALIACVFSGLAAESLTNWYAHTSGLGGLVWRSLERLDPVGKLILVHHWVTGERLESGSEPMQSLQLLVTLRNELVHDKVQSVSLQALVERCDTLVTSAKRSVEAIGCLFALLTSEDSD